MTIKEKISIQKALLLLESLLTLVHYSRGHSGTLSDCKPCRLAGYNCQDEYKTLCDAKDIAERIPVYFNIDEC